MYNTGFDITPNALTMEFTYGEGIFGCTTEKRKLDDIRVSLSNPDVEGPDVVYAVAMDVGKQEHKDDLMKRNLLYGAMIFANGLVGNEPVRSQGHVHAVSASCGCSTPEVYEIWTGEAYIYMQKFDGDKPGKCYVVYAKAGDVVIVPPGWAHSTINANTSTPMTFGAWCVRDYGFDYKGVREHHGLAYFPIVEKEVIRFVKNEAYDDSELEILEAREYPEFGLKKGVPIYTQYEKQPDLFTFVSNPDIKKDIWKHYKP